MSAPAPLPTGQAVGLHPSALLGELTLERFLAEHWQRRPLCVQGRPGRLRGLFDLAAYEAATARCEGLKLSLRNAAGQGMELPCGPLQAAQGYAQGGTVCISGILGNPVLDGFLREVAAWLPQGGELSFNCYRSPDGQGFGLHLDDHPVWILQIEGRKRWWYSRAPHPFVRGTASFAEGASHAVVPWSDQPITRPPPDAFDEVVLAPGDVLYLPEGCWHRAAADGESLALTLACNRCTPLDLVQRVLGPRLAHLPALTGNVSGWAAAAARGDPPPCLMEELAGALQAVRTQLDTLTPEVLRDALVAQARARSAG